MSFHTVNPTNGSILNNYDFITREKLFSSLQQAHDAYTSWRQLSLDQRQEYFKKLLLILENKAIVLSEMSGLEVGKPVAEGRAEVSKCAGLVQHYIDNAATYLQSKSIQADGKEHRVDYAPLGVILSVMPWNFPYWQIMRFCVPSLMAGNTTLVKPALESAECALQLEQCFIQAGFPAGVFQVVLARHGDIEEIISSPLIAGFSFTGSTNSGKHLAGLAGKNLKKVVLELGGSDPFIMLPDANFDHACQEAARSRLLNCGQSCIAAKRLIVPKEKLQEVSQKLQKHFEKRVIGDPLSEETTLGPLYSKKAVVALQAVVEDALSKGARIFWQGKMTPAFSQVGDFFAPMILSNINSSMRVYHEEVFGPIALLLSYESVDEALVIANSTHFGLGASVWGHSQEELNYFATNLEVGSVFINAMVKSDARMPFGGVKESGLGRELSQWGIQEFTNIKAINIYPEL